MGVPWDSHGIPTGGHRGAAQAHGNLLHGSGSEILKFPMDLPRSKLNYAKLQWSIYLQGRGPVDQVGKQYRNGSIPRLLFLKGSSRLLKKGFIYISFFQSNDRRGKDSSFPKQYKRGEKRQNGEITKELRVCN